MLRPGLGNLSTAVVSGPGSHGAILTVTVAAIFTPVRSGLSWGVHSSHQCDKSLGLAALWFSLVRTLVFQLVHFRSAGSVEFIGRSYGQKTGCLSPTTSLSPFHFTHSFPPPDSFLHPPCGDIRLMSVAAGFPVHLRVCVSLDVVSNPPSPQGPVCVFSHSLYLRSEALPPLPVPSMPPLTKSGPGCLRGGGGGGGDTAALMTGHCSSASASPCRLTCNTLTSLHTATETLLACVSVCV